MESPVPRLVLILRDVAISDVKPRSAGAQREFKIIEPTTRDAVFKNFMCPSLFAYRNDNNADGSEIVERMKAALSKTLDLFYPVAGRYVTDPKLVGSGPGPGSGQPHLVCNDKGVPFIEAYADIPIHQVLPVGDKVDLRTFQVSRVSDLYMRGVDMFGKDLTVGSGPFDRELPDGGLPALVIQVTRFKCGGVVIAPSYSHMRGDATSFAHFMKAWSDIAISGETAIAPDFNRGWVNDMIRFPQLDMPPGIQDRQPDISPYVKLVFEVSKSAVESMKQEVQKDTNGARFVSTVDCISAHFWHSLVRLQSSSTSPELSGKVVRSFGVVEGRSTSKDPPLPRYLFGNVMKPMLHPVVPPEELLKRPPSSAALRLRDFIKSRNNPEGWGSPQIWKEFYLEIRFNQRAATWCTTSLSAFPFYDIRFELLGKPAFVCPATHTMPKEGDFGRAVIYPPLPLHGKTSSATAHLEINPKYVDLVCSDSQFMSIFLDSEPQRST